MVNIDPTGKPMMADHEIKIINDLLRQHKPKICLEFGSGNSTIYFPKKHRFIKQWVAIEHIGRYVEYVNQKADLTKVIVIWVPNDQWYVDCVKHQEKKYDFVLIDGQQRQRCLEEVRKVTKEGGIILLHDSGRAEYRTWINSYPHEDLCPGEQPVDKGYAHRGLTLFRV